MHWSRRRFLKSAGAAAAFSASPLRGISLPALSAIDILPLFPADGLGLCAIRREISAAHSTWRSDGFLAEKYAADLDLRTQLLAEFLSCIHS